MYRNTKTFLMISCKPNLPASGFYAGIRPKTYRLPEATRVGKVRLAVSNLDRSVDFYTCVIGLAVLSEGMAGRERLVRLGVQGTAEVLLEVQEGAGVNSIARRTRLGLYHVAFLLPSRKGLASFVQHVSKRGVMFRSSDHLFSEALYLTDPDGFSVEVYADRPRTQWAFDGQKEGREIVSAVAPLRFRELPWVPAGSWGGAPVGTTIGHVHLYVGDLEGARRFYHEGLGLDIMTWRYAGVLFAAAGGYHHHVGLNTWAAGSPAATIEDARLLFWELVLPSDEDVAEAKASLQRAGYVVGGTCSGRPAITDPWGIAVALVARA